MHADTIAAIATSVGEAGIGIVRVSGPASVQIAQAVFRNFTGEAVSVFSARKMMYGKVRDPANDDLIDEALVVFMPAPHSYTCEDVVEFQTHGGTRVLQVLLRVVLQNGARLAQPGEFTQRAFLNGRIDLAQAEAVMDIIKAKTEVSLKAASRHLSGEFSRSISLLRRQLLELLTGMEASLDFPEDDIPLIDSNVAILEISRVRALILELLSTARTGMIMRDGLQTVIVGRPNVGKSSLLNAFLGTERALVTEIPGTTRDSIEELMNLRGIPLRIVDTAGLRETEDIVERMGIQRTKDAVASAALVLYLLDASEPLASEDMKLLTSLAEVPVIVVINKTDLPGQLDLAQLSQFCRNHSIIHISAKEKTGLTELAEAIEALVFNGNVHLSEETYVDNIRHEESLRLACDNLDAAIASLVSGMSLDCACIDLRLALESLGQITGETVSDEVVREIFAKFCLGK